MLGWEQFVEYAVKAGATKKIVGDYAFKSSLYCQRTNRGRHIKLLSVRRDLAVLIIQDNKRGLVKLPLKAAQ